MKKRHSIPMLIMALLFALTACEHEKTGPRQEHSMGKTMEILVVTQNDEQWDGMIGDTIRSFFYQFQYGLPQPEAINELAHINSPEFSELFQKHKCILTVEIDPSLKKPVVKTGENVWANPQRVIQIIAPNRTAWCETFEKNKEAFKIMFDQVERERIMLVLRPTHDDSIASKIRKKWGFDMTIPAGFFIAKNEPDFMWLRKEYDKCSFGLIIYATPYKDTLQLERDNLVTVRDRMLQRYVQGPSEGSFMSTEKVFEPPVVSYVSNYPTGFAAELRGRWCLVGDFMGGPFISYTFPDNRTGKLVTMEGYEYYPNHDKRDGLLQLQALLYSIKTVEKQ